MNRQVSLMITHRLVFLLLGIATSACQTQTTAFSPGDFVSTDEYFGMAEGNIGNTGEVWYNLYFTAPQSIGSKTKGISNMELALVNAIETSHDSLDIAIYELDLEKIYQVIIDAERRGVKVRVVTDDQSVEENSMFNDLAGKGIEIVSDRDPATMHDKFMVIDKKAVWTGSNNWTQSCIFRNDNNAVFIKSTELSADYRMEFEHMFYDRVFSRSTQDEIPYPDITIQGTSIEVCFSPHGDCAKKVIRVIQNAAERIQFMAFAFTRDDFSQALLERSRAGVSISGVFEERNIDVPESEYLKLKMAKLDVWPDGNMYNMHHKVFIIDGKTGVTGSFNFSKNADLDNNENILIIHNPDIASTYISEYEKVYALARNPQQ